MIAKKKNLITRKKGIKNKFWNQKEWDLYLGFLFTIIVTEGMFLTLVSISPFVKQITIKLLTLKDVCENIMYHRMYYNNNVLYNVVWDLAKLGSIVIIPPLFKISSALRHIKKTNKTIL